MDDLTTFDMWEHQTFLSSDSEKGEGPIPLCRQNETLQAIFYETFQSKHLTKLAHSSTNQNVKKKGKTKDEDTPEVAGLDKLLRCFKVYGQAICRYAQPMATVTTQLQIAVSEYRTRLSDCFNCQNDPTSVVVMID